MGETTTGWQPVVQQRSDEDLVRSAIGGRRENFALLYQRYYSRTYRLAFGMTAAREESEDLTQEIFIRTWQKLSQFNFESSFATWFYRLALNHCLNYRQRKIPRDAQILNNDFAAGSPTGALEAEIFQVQLQNHIHKALLTLKPKLRLILILKDIEELSYAEVAERLEISQGTVASRLNRARRQLAVKLEHLRGIV